VRHTCGVYFRQECGNGVSHAGKEVLRAAGTYLTHALLMFLCVFMYLHAFLRLFMPFTRNAVITRLLMLPLNLTAVSPRFPLVKALTPHVTVIPHVKGVR